MLFVYMWTVWLLLSVGVIVRVVRHACCAVADISGAAARDTYVAENEQALESLPVAPPEWQPQTENLQLFVIEQGSSYEYTWHWQDDHGSYTPYSMQS